MKDSTTSSRSTPTGWPSRILDLGDILTLIEQAQSAFDEAEAMKMAEKLATDSFTLEDFLDQMQQLKKMGSMKKMLGMLPGMGQMKQQLEDFDEKELDRTEAIIRSMTPIERRNPKVLNGSRRLRIARGSGMTVTDVNALVNRFEQAAKMMKTVARGGTPEHPRHGTRSRERARERHRSAASSRRPRDRVRATPPSARPRTPASQPRRPPRPPGRASAWAAARRARRAKRTWPNCRSSSAAADALQRTPRPHSTRGVRSA